MFGRVFFVGAKSTWSDHTRIYSCNYARLNFSLRIRTFGIHGHWFPQTIEEVNEPVISLVSHNLFNYCHFVVDALGKLVLALTHADPAWRNSTLLLPPDLPLFASSALAALGVTNPIRWYAPRSGVFS
jgi:hypothetical protein